MKIIILTDVYLPYLGGGQIFLSRVAALLCQKPDVEIEIVTRKLIVDGKIIENREKEFEGRLKVTRLGFPAVWNNVFARIAYIFLTTFYLINKDFDLVDSQAFVGAIPGKIVSILKRKPIILTIHGTTLETGRAGIIEKMILTKIKYNAQISVASNFLKFKNVNKNIFIASPGVDTNFYKPDFSKKEKNRILFVGRLQKVKGTETLLNCINLSAKNRFVSRVRIAQKGEREDLADTSIQPDNKWVIVGDGEEMDNLKNQIDKENIQNVELKGALNNEKTLKEYQKASVFVLPSLSEGFPLTLLEALSCGLPVVATDVGDVKKIIKEGENGFIMSSNNPKNFIEAITKILSSVDLGSAMSKNNLIKAKSYSWEKTSDDILRAYSSIAVK